MSYGRKYRVPFKDINNVDKTIYIYEDGYTGSETVLTAGANPIVWDENSSEDLNNRVRGITGRIELIEENYGDLADLYPTTPLQYLVRCQNVFYGFIKVENSTSPWQAGPRTLKFNILSPLALSYDIPMPVNTTLGMREMGEVMNEIMETLNYSYVSMPRGECEIGDFFRGQVRGMHICPYADDKDYHYANDDEIFAPISIGQFIEEICVRHDMMAHDAIDIFSASLVFSRIEGTNGMYRWTIFNISDGNYGTAEKLTTWGENSHELTEDFTIAGADNSESLVKPYSYIDIVHNGEHGDSVQMPTKQSEYKPSVSQYYLTPRGIWLTDLNGNIKLGLHGAYIDDHFEYRDTLLYNIYPNTLPTGTKLFSVTFYNVEKDAQYQLKFKYSHNMDGGAGHHNALSISARGKGGWYANNFSGSPTWPDETKVLVAISGDPSSAVTTPTTEYEKKFSNHMIADEYITVNFYIATNGDALSNIYIREIELVKRPIGESSLPSERWGEQRFVKRLTGGVGSDPLTLEVNINDTYFSNYYVTDYDFSNNNMRYLLRSQRRVQLYVRGATLDKLWYMLTYNLYEEEGWRIIALSYNVRKRIYKLTLHKVYN